MMTMTVIIKIITVQFMVSRFQTKQEQRNSLKVILQTQQMMTSQIRSYVEYLIQTYNFFLLFFIQNLRKL